MLERALLIFELGIHIGGTKHLEWTGSYYTPFVV